MTDVKKNGYYIQFDEHGWTSKEKTKTIPKGEFAGKSFRVYTKEVQHKELKWRFKKVAELMGSAVLSLCTLFLVKEIRKNTGRLWKMVKSGKEEIVARVILPASTPISQPDQPKNSKTKTPDEKNEGESGLSTSEEHGSSSEKQGASSEKNNEEEALLLESPEKSIISTTSESFSSALSTKNEGAPSSTPQKDIPSSVEVAKKVSAPLKRTIADMSHQEVCDQLRNKTLTVEDAFEVTRDQKVAMTFASIDLKNVDLEVMNAMIYGKGQKSEINVFNDHQINFLLPILSEANLKALKGDKIRELNFDRGDLPKNILKSIQDAIFEFGFPRGLESLSAKQVLDCIRHEYFDEETIKSISYDIIYEIEFEKLSQNGQFSEYQKQMINVILSVRNGGFRVTNELRVSDKRLALLWPILNPEVITGFPRSRVRQFNFAGTPDKGPLVMTKEKFAAFSSLPSEEKFIFSVDVFRMEASQVLDALRAGLFTEANAGLITEEQVKAINFRELGDEFLSKEENKTILKMMLLNQVKLGANLENSYGNNAKALNQDSREFLNVLFDKELLDRL